MTGLKCQNQSCRLNIHAFSSGTVMVLLYLMQPSQSMFPVVSLMVRSETKAGYSVSQGTIKVLPRGL